jgi:hypothetical protein
MGAIYLIPRERWLNVCCRGQSGQQMLAVRISAFDPKQTLRAMSSRDSTLALRLNKTVPVSIVVLTGLIEVPINRWTKRAACTVDGQQRLILFTYLAFFNEGAEAANAVSRSLPDGCRRQATGA